MNEAPEVKNPSVGAAAPKKDRIGPKSNCRRCHGTGREGFMEKDAAGRRMIPVPCRCVKK